jgi:hypothetical protein
MSGEVGDVARPSAGERARIGRNFSGAAAAVTNFHVLADNIEGVQAAIGAAAPGARDPAASPTALARLCCRAHTAPVRSIVQSPEKR